MTENEIGKIVVDVAVNVHKRLGPGLLESVMKWFWLNSSENEG